MHKLGHYGYMVPIPKYKETLDFYTTVMNLKHTDSVHNPQTGEEFTTYEASWVLSYSSRTRHHFIILVGSRLSLALRQYAF